MSEEQEKIAQLKRAIKRLEERAAVEVCGDGDFCSFCGKEKSEVERLIAGPSVLICNECIAECNQILKN
jgi:hypothetical protein